MEKILFSKQLERKSNIRKDQLWLGEYSDEVVWGLSLQSF